MSDQTQVTTDTSGVNRTATGEITTDKATDQSQATTTQTQQTTQQTDQQTQQTEQKTETKDNKSLLNQQDDKKQDAQKAPEKYEDYKVPEGFTLDPEIKTEADKLFKGLGLTQDEAQSLVDFYTAQTREAFEAPFNAYQEQRKEWRIAAESDPALRGKLGPGGDVLTTVAKALDGLGDAKLASDFREAMDLTGAGDNPAFIKAFYFMAQRLTEGSHVAGRGPSTAGQSRPGQESQGPAAALWPNLPSAMNRR